MAPSPRWMASRVSQMSPKYECHIALSFARHSTSGIGRAKPNESLRLQPDLVPYCMRSGVEAAVETYIRAASERDPEARAALLEACFAADGRIVSRRREIRGRAALADEIAKLLAE